MTRLGLSLAFACAGILAACADQRLEQMQHRSVIPVPANNKVIAVLWEGDQVGVIYRPMLPTETAEDWQFHRASATGLNAETVIIHEARDCEDSVMPMQAAKE